MSKVLEHGTDRRNIRSTMVDISPLVKSFLAGSLSGTCSTVLFQPLDLLKTRIQSPVTVSNGVSSGGMVSTVRYIVRTERVLGLWKGVAPSMMRCVPGVGLYFGCVDWLRTNVGHPSPHPLESIAIGASARTISATLLIPFTVVKTRYESRYYSYVSVVDALTKIHMEEGPRGLTRGLTATILRDAPFSGCYLMFYTYSKQFIPTEVLLSSYQPLSHFACGLVAGVLASSVTQPADVIKTKMQLFPGRFANISDVVIYIYQTYGLRGYLKGLAPRALRRTLMAAMAWAVYEQLTLKVGLH